MNHSQNNPAEDKKTFNPQDVILYIKKHWKLHLIGLVVCLSVAFVFLRYSIERYSSYATVLVKDSNDNTIGSALEFNGVELLGGGNAAESEVEILKSRTLVSSVVDKLELSKEIYWYGGRAGLKKRDLYKKSPFWVDAVAPIDSTKTPQTSSFKVTLKNKSNFVVKTNDDRSIELKESEIFKINGQKYKLKSTKNYREFWQGQEFEVVLRSKNALVTEIQKAIEISTSKSDIGILTIQIEGLSIERNNDIINSLIDLHQIAAVKEKNRIAENTRNFLLGRLQLIEDKLASIERKGEELKINNSIVNVESEVASILGQEKDLEKKLLELGVKQSLALQMKEVLDNNKNLSSLIPVNLGFESQSLTNSVNEYNQLIFRRNNLLASSSEENPAAQKMKAELVSSLENIKMSLNAFLSSINSQIGRIQSDLYSSQSKKTQIPIYEVKYRDIMREQQIREALYLMLLQKKEENEILLSSTQGNIRVIDYAFSTGKPVSPKKKKIYLIALLLGAIIPTAFVYLRSLLYTKLNGVSEVERLGLPCIGEIPLLDSVEDHFAHAPKSRTSEAFRMLRTNLNFILQENQKVIMVTSTIPGEGKTFVTINLANSIANTGKKVAIIGLDLRLPKLMEYLGLEYTIGVSNYLASNDIQRTDIKYEIEKNKNISIYPSGTIPPNPSELLTRVRLKELFEELRHEYDYVLIDTSPIGMVSDSLSIAQYADLSIFVARVGRLEKKQLQIASKLYQEKKIPSMHMLVNGITVENNQYGYGYGYGYSEDYHKPSKRSIFKKKRRN